jgi:hypothetical protein
MLGVQRGIRFEGLAVISGVLRRRIASIRLPSLREGISVDMLKPDYLPYKASQTYRKIMTEFDHTRTLAIFEVKRQQLLMSG